MYRIDRQKETVSEIQRYLRELDDLYGRVPKLSVDGIYGEETREAVRALQRREGLTVTGETDKETLEVLYRDFRRARAVRLSAATLLPLDILPLALGDSGSYVKILQSVLGEILADPIPTDGFFGRATEEGVREAQRRYGLPDTRTVTDTLWQLLCEEYASRISQKMLEG